MQGASCDFGSSARSAGENAYYTGVKSREATGLTVTLQDTGEIVPSSHTSASRQASNPWLTALVIEVLAEQASNAMRRVA